MKGTLLLVTPERTAAAGKVIAETRVCHAPDCEQCGRVAGELLRGGVSLERAASLVADVLCRRLCGHDGAQPPCAAHQDMARNALTPVVLEAGAV